VAQALVAADAAHAAHVAATAAKAAKMGFVEVLPLLSAEPTTMQRPISTADRFLILACDGVWDVLSGQQACDSVRAALEESEGDPNAAARKLAGDAYKANSEDNISVIVCKLRHELV
jgi:serine/threonine protein phosphatase PrpC